LDDDSCLGIIQIQTYFKLKNGFLPGGSITMTIQHTNTQVTYTIHISHKITPLKTSKTKKNKSAHKATETVKNILRPVNRGNSEGRITANEYNVEKGKK
jgi:hypothetical protein